MAEKRIAKGIAIGYIGQILRIGTAEPEWIYDEGFPYDPDEKATVGDRASWAYWGTLNAGAQAIGHMPDATKAYSHYRAGSGENLPVDLEKACEEEERLEQFFERIVNMAKGDAEGYINSILEDPLSKSMYSDGRITLDFTSVLYAITGSDYPESENWRKALGGFSCWSHGVIYYSESSYTLDIYLTVKDRYNFDINKKDMNTGTSDEVNGRFSTLGWAKEFTSVGTIHKVISWS